MRRFRADVALGPVTDRLRAAMVEQRWLEDPETNRLLGYGRGLPGIVALKEQVAEAIVGDGPTAALGVYCAGDPVGLVLLVQAPGPRRAVRFVMLLAPAARGRFNVAPSALTLLCERILQSTRIYRLETEVLDSNKRAIRWLKHEGLAQEGFRKHSWWSDGDPHSTVSFRMLAPQWRRLRKDRCAGSAGAQGRLQTDPVPGSNPGPAASPPEGDEPTAATTFAPEVVHSAGEEVTGQPSHKL